MKTSLVAAAFIVGLAFPSMAQQAAPQAAQPTITRKAGDIAGQALNKLTAPPTPAATTAAVAPKAAPIDINKATPAELDALPSIGKARAAAIVAGRPYKSVQDLMDRKILPKDSFETVKDRIAVK